jgi:hypothetical protein
VLLDISSDGTVSSELHRVDYDVATMAAAIRDADGLPDHYAIDIETGGQYQ